jgi:hypothetical protein
MGGYMPYQLEKGPYYSVTESVLGDLGLRINVLLGLLAGADPTAMPSLDSTSLDPAAGGIDVHADRITHQDVDWYGRTVPAPGGGLEQPPFDPLAPTSTGFWHNWYGDAEGIVHETYQRAIEVSLGLPHHDPTSALPTAEQVHEYVHENEEGRFWPIEIFSRCPAPWFEGWVTWRGHGKHDGHVTIHLHTPSHTSSNLLNKPERAATYQRPEYQDEPSAPAPPYLTSQGREHGMWVIAHEEQELIPTPPPVPTPPANGETAWPQPWFGGFVYSHGQIVVVQPSEPNGGVLAGGRPYTL